MFEFQNVLTLKYLLTIFIHSYFIKSYRLFTARFNVNSWLQLNFLNRFQNQVHLIWLCIQFQRRLCLIGGRPTSRRANKSKTTFSFQQAKIYYQYAKWQQIVTVVMQLLRDYDVVT